MKKIYEAPQLDKTTFLVEDVVTTSPTNPGIVLPYDDWE